jgi:hypothetical protein
MKKINVVKITLISIGYGITRSLNEKLNENKKAKFETSFNK